MRRAFLAAVAAALVLPFILGGSGVAAPAKSLTVTNRVAPSGTVTMDPTTAAHLPTYIHPPKNAPIPGPGSNGCPDSSATNVRANQECTNQSAAGFLGRGQSQNETSVAVNPTDPANVVISQNDYRLGDAKCGVDWSLNGGKKWGSQLAPVDFGLSILDSGGTRHYWTTSGDTSVAFDSSGEAYLMCQVFDRAFPTDERGSATIFGVDASGFMLFRSGDGGASWNFTGSYVATTAFGEGGTSDVGLLDKEYMTIDNNPNSPFANRIYVTWAQYATDGSNSPTFFAYSDDFGNSWSTPAEISGKSKSLCPITFSSRTDFSCDESQYNDPFVGPDGAVYDAFVNFNNCNGSLRAVGFDCPGDINDNHNQILLVKSTDGGVTWSSPVKVGTFFDLPDCFTYTGSDFGRACVPTAPLSTASIFRASNYPSGVATSATQVVVDYGTYINRDSNPRKGNCAPAGISTDTFLNLYTGVGNVNGCNNDIVRSVSTNAGGSFTGTTTPPASLPTSSKELGRTLADQWWHWTAQTPRGHAVSSYYDRSYGDDMARGYLDVTLANPDTALWTRVTDSSLPASNEFPDATGYSTFMGDYTGLAVGPDGMAHPAWADTRNPIYTFDSTAGGDPRVLTFAGYGEDIYTRSLRA